MNKTEIKIELERIVQEEEIQNFLDKGKELVKAFWAIYNEQEKNKVDDELPDDSTVDAESALLDEEIKNLIEKFKTRNDQLEKAIVEHEKKNFEIKQGLISRLRNLIQHEENIGALFTEIKEIQETWKGTGNIPRKVAQEINQEYHNLTEQFYYNINIYKELKENDLKKNYSLKNQVVHKMKELLEQDRISLVQEQLRTLQNEWAEIGPTYQENWEKLKNEFYTAQNEVYEKIRVFYEERKLQQEKSLETKKELLNKAKELNATELNSTKDWDTTTKKMVGVQNEWKKSGYSASKDNKVLWKEFRAVCNDFFDRKSAFFKTQNGVFKENETLKAQLVEKAMELLNTNDFKSGTKTIDRTSKKVEKIGPRRQTR